MNNAWLKSHIPEIVICWRANLDIQIVVDTSNNIYDLPVLCSLEKGGKLPLPGNT